MTTSMNTRLAYFKVTAMGFYGNRRKSTNEKISTIESRLEKIGAIEYDVVRCSDDSSEISVGSFENLLQDIISIHKSHRPRTFSNFSNTRCLNHMYLYRALGLCKLFGDIINYQLVQSLLSEIYICDGDLHSVFSIISVDSKTFADGSVKKPGFGNAFGQYIYGQRCLVDDDYRMKSFEFLLKHIPRNMFVLNHRHASWKNLLNEPIDSNNISPLMLATMKREVSSVLLLLRYGADPFVVCGSSYDNLKDSSEYIISYLNSILYFKTVTKNDHVLGQLISEQEKALQCFQYFFRSVVNIPLKTNNNIFDIHENKRVYYASPNLAALFDMGKFKSPRPLMHLCRIKVRSSMINNNNMSIPDAIQTLEIPSILRKYLDLRVD